MENQGSTKVKLWKLLDTSLSVSEPGYVNFNLLRQLFSTIINHLKIGDLETNIDGDILENSGSSAQKFNDNSCRTIHDRLQTLETQINTLNALPDNRELLAQVFPPSKDSARDDIKSSQNQHRVSDLWQTVQMTRRVDAAEEGLSRLSSLTDDLLNQIKRLTEENEKLKSEISDIKRVPDLTDKLLPLEKKLAELEERQKLDEALLKNVVHMDALRGLVFWHGLGKAITGLDYIVPQKNAEGSRTDNIDVDDQKEPMLVKKLPEDYIACPDPGLSNTLHKLGIVASGFDKVLQRIDRLENKKLIKSLQDNLAVLQKQIAQMHQLISSTQQEMKKVHDQFKDLQQFAEDLDTRKSDATYVDSELLKKADKFELEKFLTQKEFQENNQELHQLVEDLFNKLTNAEEELRTLITTLEGGLDGKLDRDEFDQLREWLEKRFRALATRMRSVTSVSPPEKPNPIGDEAAGLRRSLMNHYHCISCDRPLQVQESGQTIYDVYGVPRRCGGTHTSTNPQKRVNRGNAGRNTVCGDEYSRILPFVSPREEVNVEGFDGQIYRGRLISMNTREPRERSQSPVSRPSDDMMETIKLPHIPGSKPVLSGWQQDQTSTPQPQSPNNSRKWAINNGPLPPRISGSPERRRVQWVQPNARSYENLATTPTGYAVIVMPSTNNATCKDTNMRASSAATKVSCPTSEDLKHPKGGLVNLSNFEESSGKEELSKSEIMDWEGPSVVAKPMQSSIIDCTALEEFPTKHAVVATPALEGKTNDVSTIGDKAKLDTDEIKED